MSVGSKTNTATDVMQTQLKTVGPETKFSEAIATMIRSGVSGLPIIDADRRYLGMFSEKCGLRFLNDHPEVVAPEGSSPPIAHEAMATKLVLLRDNQDVFDGITQLVENRVSGAPVVDAAGTFAGIFSEKTSMSVLIQSVYEGLQSAEIRHFADRNPRRVASETTPISDIVRTFVETEFRRLPVVDDGHVKGQISRRDVINHPQIFQRMISVQADTIGGDDRVLSLADTSAKTIEPNLDLLSIIGLFLNTPYRRLPVLDNGIMIGQISRRDVLRRVLDASARSPEGYRSVSLYLSAKDTETPRFS